jgi:hypothetical protein
MSYRTKTVLHCNDVYFNIICLSAYAAEDGIKFLSAVKDEAGK